jgi:hypothetical protein
MCFRCQDDREKDSVELLIYILAWIVPPAILGWIRAEQDYYGEDWREGKRYRDAVNKEYARREAVRKDQGYCEEELYPSNAWWPPRDVPPPPDPLRERAKRFLSY